MPEDSNETKDNHSPEAADNQDGEKAENSDKQDVDTIPYTGLVSPKFDLFIYFSIAAVLLFNTIILITP